MGIAPFRSVLHDFPFSGPVQKRLQEPVPQKDEGDQDGVDKPDYVHGRTRFLSILSLEIHVTEDYSLYIVES